MWISPNHPNPPRQAAPPQEAGERLATCERPKGEELRVTAETYNNHPYVRIQAWIRNDHGEYWPIKGKCATIKPRELGAIIQALRQAERLIAEGHGAAPGRHDGRQPSGRTPDARGRPGGQAAAQNGGHDDRPRYVERRGRPQPREYTPPEGRSPADREFDEFGGAR